MRRAEASFQVGDRKKKSRNNSYARESLPNEAEFEFAFLVAQPGIGGLFYSAVTFQLQRKPIKRTGVARDVRVSSDVSEPGQWRTRLNRTSLIGL